MTILNILAIITSIISIISVIWIVAFKLASMAQKIDSLENNGCHRLQAIDAKVTRLMVQMEPFWAIVENKIAGSLKSPHSPEYDDLLDRLKDCPTAEELNKLSFYLEEDLQKSIEVQDMGRTLSIALVLSMVESKKKAML